MEFRLTIIGCRKIREKVVIFEIASETHCFLSFNQLIPRLRVSY